MSELRLNIAPGLTNNKMDLMERIASGLENEEIDLLNLTPATFDLETVTVLHYPFEPISHPPGINREEYLQAIAQAKVYLVGTSHFSKNSCKDVEETVQANKPDFIMVELSSSREHMMYMDEQTLLREVQELTGQKIMDIMRKHGTAQGLLQVLLLSVSAYVTQKLGVAPGGEFRAAYNASKEIAGCQLVLGDRSSHVTLNRAFSSMNFFQKMKFLFQLNLQLLWPTLVDERDQYMTHRLQLLLQQGTVEKLSASKKNKTKFEPVTVVAVVGMGHVEGIHDHWGQHIDADALLIIPPPSLTSRIVKTGFRVAFYGGAIAVSAWIGYRVTTKILE